MKVALLAGGYGGARFAQALAETVDPAGLTVIGNVGDDLEVLGLHVSPDLDTVLYTLAGLLDPERGWGRAEETWNALEAAGALGADTWFRLGDRDLGLHLVRTEALASGEPLSSVTARLAAQLGVATTLLPATDDRLRTWVETPSGSFSFQEWFVARGHEDEVDGVRFEGAESAAAAPGVVAALEGEDLILIAPSNPYVSIWPILAVGKIRAALEARSVPCVAVSPLIGGKTVKGPADRMLARMAGGTTPVHVTQCYLGVIDSLVFDKADAEDAEAVAALGVWPVTVTQTLMRDAESRRRLADARARGRDRARMKIAILGGTGPFGRALARRLKEAGHDVVIGSRDAERAQEAAAESGVEGGLNQEIVRGADLVVLAVNAEAAQQTAKALARAIGSTPLLCVASELRFGEGGARPGAKQRSPVERVADVVAGPVVAGLHSVAASSLASDEPRDEDALVCGDDEKTKELVLELAGGLVAGRAVDAGPLASARALEGMTAVIVNVNRRYKANAGLRVTGL